jgi:hypothetical protein
MNASAGMLAYHDYFKPIIDEQDAPTDISQKLGFLIGRRKMVIRPGEVTSFLLRSNPHLGGSLIVALKIGAITMPAKPTIKNAILQSSMLATTPPKTIPIVTIGHHGDGYTQPGVEQGECQSAHQAKLCVG